MKKVNVLNNISCTVNRMGLKIKKYSPEVFIVAGVIGTVASAVMACKATTKLSGILEESKSNIDDIHSYVDENGYTEKYSEEDEKKDLSIVYAQTGVKLVKLYAPSVVLGMLSISAILTSNQILRKRNIALATAYKAIDTSFKEYRGRVVERFGEAVDKELKYNIKKKEIEEIVKDETTGEETTVTKTVDVLEGMPSDFARIYDDGCIGWTKDPEMNMMFLRRQQDYANEKFKRQGHLFLNDVYEMLGIQKSRAGQMVGWIYDEKHPIGDNYIDFGIYNIYSEANRRFVNGYERNILLDFNVDGNILDFI